MGCSAIVACTGLFWERNHVRHSSATVAKNHKMFKDIASELSDISQEESRLRICNGSCGFYLQEVSFVYYLQAVKFRSELGNA